MGTSAHLCQCRVSPGSHSRAGSCLRTQGRKSFQLPRAPSVSVYSSSTCGSPGNNGFFTFLTFSGITTGTGRLLLFSLSKAAGREASLALPVWRQCLKTALFKTSPWTFLGRRAAVRQTTRAMWELTMRRAAFGQTMKKTQLQTSQKSGTKRCSVSWQKNHITKFWGL